MKELLNNADGIGNDSKLLLLQELQLERLRPCAAPTDAEQPDCLRERALRPPHLEPKSNPLPAPRKIPRPLLLGPK